MSIEHLGANRIDGPDACAKILIVGELNPYGAEARYALYHEPANAAGRRLQEKVMGVRARQTYLPMWRTNLCVGGWDHDDATRKAASLLSYVAPWRVIIMLGMKVSAAFGRLANVPRIDPFTAAEVAGMVVDGAQLPSISIISIPHPSGRNKRWLESGAIPRARQLLAGVAPDVPWGELDATTGEP